MPIWETISADLRACTTRQDIERVSDKYRADVRAMYLDKDTAVHAIHISNLKAHLLGAMKHDQP